MNFDGPRESGSMPMDVDDSAVSYHYSDRCDTVEMNSPGSSGRGTPFNPDPKNHELADSAKMSTHSLSSHPSPDYDRLPGSDHSPRLIVLAPSSSPVIHLREAGNIYENRGLAVQQRAIFPGLQPSSQDVTSRKRKRSLDLPHTHITNHNDIPHHDAFADGANSQSRRRTRPRLRTQQEGEFSPLLIISPGQERGTFAEETISMFHFHPPPNATDPSHSIRRYFHLENPPEHDPRIMQSSSSSMVDDLGDPTECSRSDSASSFAEVALASTSTAARKSSRLSSLKDLSLPLPFEDTEQPSMSSGVFKVHERGLEALPSFLSTSDGRMGGLWASREPAGILGHPIRPPVDEHGAHASSSRFGLPPLEPSPTVFLDKPLCESPDEIEPDEDGLVIYSTTGNNDGR